MGFEYALVHLKYTIPPGIILTLLYRPFFHPLELYKIVFLVCVAVVSTIPWDSYLIRRKIWTYPPNVIVGPTLFDIPAEELFFFIIQTYNTSLLYLISSKPLFHPKYLTVDKKNFTHWIGHIIFAVLAATGGALAWEGNEGTYLGLILLWAALFALLLWACSSQFLMQLPFSTTVTPIALPTLYLWVVDTMALKRGTWNIEPGTKLGIHIWEGLEIEEAIFFLATNTLIVFGLIAFDHALTILWTFPKLFPDIPSLPSPVKLIQALLTDTSDYDGDRLAGIQQAVARLQMKSRSFYLASATFSGRLRIDLILLYSFCRVADDLVDNAKDETEAREWIGKLSQYLKLTYLSEKAHLISKHQAVHIYIAENFPEAAQFALRLLPTNLLPSGPLYGLLEGFKTDLDFHHHNGSKTAGAFPISKEYDLEVYAARVAGTIAELCLQLVFHHNNSKIPPAQQDYLIQSGGRMGIALQYVNIARDVSVDAAIGRVYLPTSWLKGVGISPESVLERPKLLEVEILRRRLLNKAFEIHQEAKPAIAQLPLEARAPMRVAVESYMEIGRVLRKNRYRVKEGRATVPKFRRLRVAWKALNEE